MPITVNPIQATRTVTAQQQVPCDHLFIDLVAIDASDRSRPPRLELRQTPYAVTDAGNVYADPLPPVRSDNLYGVAANVPEVAAWLVAGYAAAKALHDWVEARRADLAEAQAAELAAADARASAFTSRSGPDDPAWVQADAAWQTAARMAAAALAAANDPANRRA